MLQEFKKFIMRGNVMDMAVGIVIGAAFGAIVTSLVKDVITPPVGLLLGGVDFTNLFAVIQEGATVGPYATLAAAQEAGAITVNYGIFVNSVVSFLIVALAIFIVVKQVNNLQKKEEAKPATTKNCPFCMSSIAIKATRCSACTSELAAG